MDRIGPYRLVRVLGSGGMGVVHEAWDTGLERPVALKVISSQLADDPGFRERFTREARAQAALASGHVVPVYAHGEDAGRLWIASQLIPDGDLGRLLREYGAPPVPVALSLIDQVAAGLADAHAAGLVHRDIKPANVLLRRGTQIRAYLCDFGIAQPLGSEATRTGTVGTPAYLAPELHTGGRAGVASDVYSLGCLLWAVLTGRPPYAGGTDFEVATAHREQPVPQLPGSDPLNVVLRTAMAKRPEDRYPSAAAFREALAAPTGTRRRRWWLAAVPVAALVLAGVAWAVWPDERPKQPEQPERPASVDAEQRATTELAASLGGAMTAAQADCAAAYVVDDLGFGALVEAGFFAVDGEFLNPDLAGQPEIKQSLTAAALACA